MTATGVIERYAAAWLYDQQQHLVDRAWSQP